jgi:hypothetical protein
MTSKTKGTIGTREFVLLEENIKPVMEFPKATESVLQETRGKIEMVNRVRR